MAVILFCVAFVLNGSFVAEHIILQDFVIWSQTNESWIFKSLRHFKSVTCHIRKLRELQDILENTLEGSLKCLKRFVLHIRIIRKQIQKLWRHHLMNYITSPCCNHLQIAWLTYSPSWHKIMCVSGREPPLLQLICMVIGDCRKTTRIKRFVNKHLERQQHNVFLA